MNNTRVLNNVSNLCRICLTKYRRMVPLNTSFGDSNENISIIEALEDVLGIKIIWTDGYPTVVCPTCLDFLTISYNFMVQFRNSQKILLQQFGTKSDDCRMKDKKFSDQCSPVEIIFGSNKYSLKDILIVEEEKSDQNDFRGFLNNLGKTITAKFVRESKNSARSRDEEEPIVVFIKKEVVEPRKEVKFNTKCVDQFIKFQDNDTFVQGNSSKENLFLQNLDIENLPEDDQKLMRSALNKQLECNNCHKFYASKIRLMKHLESCEKLQWNTDDVLPSVIKCNLCSRTFKEKKLLNYHVRTNHSDGPSEYKCEICKEILRNKGAYKYHKRTKHGERKFICHICNKKFFTSAILKSHLLIHAQQKIPQCVCPICGKTFHYKGGLFYHMKLHTNDRKYCCEFCDRKFYTLNAKKRHSLTHTGVRPYPCHYCEKRFYSTGEARKHEYLHTGVRPYCCQYCKKGFCSSYNMKIHLLSHPGPYACKFCVKTFVNMNVLRFHHKIKHLLLEETENS